MKKLINYIAKAQGHLDEARTENDVQRRAAMLEAAGLSLSLAMELAAEADKKIRSLQS